MVRGASSTEIRVKSSTASSATARQLTALDAGGAEPVHLAAWRAALAAEVTAMDNERRRFAWEQGLPEATRASLEPFRDRLEASYDRMTGVLETAAVNRIRRPPASGSTRFRHQNVRTSRGWSGSSGKSSGGRRSSTCAKRARQVVAVARMVAPAVVVGEHGDAVGRQQRRHRVGQRRPLVADGEPPAVPHR